MGDGGAQMRLGDARLECTARRTLPCNHGPEGRAFEETGGGEHYCETGGEGGGFGKSGGGPPQKTFSVGFIAEGFESSRPYRRMPDSYHRTVDWIMKGVEGEMIGD